MTALTVPAYFHPALASAEWSTLASGMEVSVVVNPASGPGSVRDPEYVAVLEPLRAAGVRLIGYVDTDYRRRPRSRILADVQRHQDFYGISEVFFDQVSSGCDDLGWYRGLIRRVRSAGVSGVILNPGVTPHPGYFEHADAVTVFEGPSARFRDAALDVAGGCPRWALVYDTPAEELVSVLASAVRRGISTVYVTDRCGANPWNGLPAYFDRQLDLLGLTPA